MRHAAETLDELGVAHETKIVSAHRTPKRLFDYAHSAKERGLKVVIAGAGGAAHLPGMTASMTSLPVLGVPIETPALKGIDSLLSIVQMPAGVPVGTLAIGKAGAINAALLAAAILATGDAALVGAARGVAREANGFGRRSARMTVPPGSTIGIVGGGQLGRMLSMAAARLGYKCHIFDPHERPLRGRRCGRLHPRGVRRPLGPRALRRRGRRRDLRIRESRRSEPLELLGDKLRPAPGRSKIAQDRGDGKAVHRSDCGARVAPWRAVASLDRRVRRRRPSSGCPIVSKTRRWGYDGKGQAWIHSERGLRRRLARDRRGAGRRGDRRSISSPNSR